MPQFYRVLKADPLDGTYTPNKPGAKPLQSFWCQVEGVEEPVMMSKQVPNTPSLTEGHYGVLESRTSAKGNSYWKFTSMPIPQGQSKPKYADVVDMGKPENVEKNVHPSDQKDTPLWFAPYAIMIREIHKYVQEQNAEEVLTAPDSPDTATEDARPTIDEMADIFGDVDEVEIK